MGNICDIFSNRKKKSHEIKNTPKIIENRYKIEFTSIDDIVIPFLKPPIFPIIPFM